MFFNVMVTNLFCIVYVLCHSVCVFIIKFLVPDYIYIIALVSIALQ